MLVMLGCFTGSTAVAAVTAVAASPPPAEQARDQAVQQLIDRVLALDVVAQARQQSLAMLLSGSPVAQRQLRQAILPAMQISEPRRNPPGATVVDAWIDTSRLQQIIQSVAAEHLSWPPEEKITLLPDIGPAVVADGEAPPGRVPRAEIIGWQHCTPAQMEWTAAAAEIDLHERLFSYIIRLPVSIQSPQGQELFRSHTFRSVLRDIVAQVQPSEPTYEPTGLCLRQASIRRSEMITMLQEATRQSGMLRTIDFSVLNAALPEPLDVMGYAVAPLMTEVETEPSTPPPPDGPEWARQILTADATGMPPAELNDPELRRELAITAATIEARRRLWMEIEQLPWPEGGTVGERLIQSEKTAQWVRAINRNIFSTTEPDFDDQGMVTIRLGIRLETVWQLLQKE